MEKCTHMNVTSDFGKCISFDGWEIKALMIICEDCDDVIAIIPR